MNLDKFKQKIRSVMDFPIEGINFLDITTLLKDKEAFKEIMDVFIDRYKDKNIDYIVGADARGFIFGPVIAYAIGAGFVPVRKKGKLPYKTKSVKYSLEYGTNEIEIHEDAIEKGKRCILIDDLLATGGTAAAMTQLVKDLGAEIVEVAFMIELDELKGRELIDCDNVFSILHY